MTSSVHETISVDLDLIDLYKDLHSHPELGFHEQRTSSLVERHLTALGFDTTTGVGTTGVVGVLKNGAGPTALLRADMDALPVREETGLDYASTVTTTDDQGKTVSVSHACGHDLHTTCLLGAARILSQDTTTWSGTLVLVFQPAEELGAGAQAMVDDGLFERFPKPDIVLGQHVSPLPAGTIAGHAGPSYAGSDSLRVRLVGKAPTDLCRRTRSIPWSWQPKPCCVCKLSSHARSRVLPQLSSPSAPSMLEMPPTSFPAKQNCNSTSAATTQVCVSASWTASTASSGAKRPPPALPPHRPSPRRSTFRSSSMTRRRWTRHLMRLPNGWGRTRFSIPAQEQVVKTSHSRDQCRCATVVLVVGRYRPSLFTTGDMTDPALRTVPSNHSPHYAPVIEPTLTIGVNALVVAARTWLPTP